MLSFIQGITIGLASLAPIGLQNLFVINTALSQRRRRTYFTALVVIFFDISLSFACFFGVSAIMAQSRWISMAVLLMGSAVVLYIGTSLLRDKGLAESSSDTDLPVLKVITTACVVTWFNPQAIIDCSMMLGAFRASLPPGQSLNFICGVALASCCWFLGISTVISLFRTKITPKVLRAINIICGIVIIFYGLKLAVNFVRQLTEIL